MPNVLRLSPQLSLPIDAATQRFSFLGRIGSGKSYASTKMAELLFDAGAQVIALDPVGIWYGLRVDGKGKGLSIPVFGGLHGDLPLEPTGGEIMADLVVDRALSCVIDVSQFRTDKEKARFAADFADRFYWRKKATPGAVHIFLEECQEFVPQNPQKGEELMLHHWTRMAKLGRNFGIGLSLITQRPQEVNKKVLNLTECLFAFQMTGVHERKAIRDWVTAKGADDKILDVLPTLPVGVAHIYSPQWLQVSQQVKVYEKRSADVSSTPLVGAEPTQPRPLAPVDIDALREKMAATIEKAKADDPKTLRARIVELERASGKTPVGWVSHETMVSQINASVSAAQREMQQRYEGLLRGAERAQAALLTISQSATDAASAVGTTIADGGGARLAAVSTVRIAPKPERPARPALTSGVVIGKGERVILTAIAQHRDGVSREQLTVLTGYKRSSRDTYLQRILAAGYAQGNGVTLTVTDAGIAVLGDDYEPLPTGRDLAAHWMGRLSGGEQKLLGVLLAANGRPVSRDRLSDESGYLRSSRDTYLQRLAARKLVVSDRDGVRASEALFG